MALSKLCSVLPARIDKAANELKKQVVRVIDQDVVDHTPVDVTTAVSNWQPSINEPPFVGIDAIVPGSHGSTAPQSRAEAIAWVERTLKEVDPGEAFYLSNLTPYIEDLNDGTSKQEPAGFVERAIRKGELYAATAKLEIDQ